MRIMLLGAPGSGKGTQAALLKERYGIAHISTGDILRSEVARGTDLGHKAEPFVKQGKLVPDDVMLGMIEARLAEPDAMRGWLLDGFPRTLVQVHGLVDVTERIGQKIDVGIILHVAPEIVVRRLSGRRNCANCKAVTNVGDAAAGGVCAKCGGPLVLRDDDEPETVRNRIQVFGRETQPVFELLRGRYDVIDIDAAQGQEQVADAIWKALSKYA